MQSYDFYDNDKKFNIGGGFWDDKDFTEDVMNKPVWHQSSMRKKNRKQNNSRSKVLKATKS